MAHMELNQEAMGRIQKLIEANFTGRDELYAAAQSLDDEARRRVCRRLADHLAGHAAELQQIVTACGVPPAEPLDTESMAHALFELAKMNHGEQGVLDAAAHGEQNLKDEYERAIDATSDRRTESVLHRQKKDVTLGEEVLRGMIGADEETLTGTQGQEPAKDENKPDEFRRA